MNVDTRIFFDRYLVAFYRRGKPTVKDIETGRTVDLLADAMPLTPEGFAALFLA